MTSFAQSLPPSQSSQPRAIVAAAARGNGRGPGDRGGRSGGNRTASPENTGTTTTTTTTGGSSATTVAVWLGVFLAVLAFIAVAFFLLRRFRPFDQDRYSRREDLAQAQIRPGLNIDNLPIVKVDFGQFKPAQNVPKPGGGDDGGAGTVDAPAVPNVAQIRQECLTTGYYLGPLNEYADCVDVCGVSSDKEVRYAYLSDTSGLVSGHRPMRPGSWCLPTTAANCNLSTSLVVYSINGWLCLPRSDAFAGEGGNRIVVCNGSIYDNALQVTHKEFIPSNLAFNDFYEDRLSDGRYRFVCPPQLEDDLRNAYLTSPFDRFHLLRNWCTDAIPFATPGSQPDFTYGSCVCKPPYGRDPQSGKCSVCSQTFNQRDYTFSLGNQPCFSVRDYVHLPRYLLDVAKNPDMTILPCGLSHSSSSTSDEVTRPRCRVTMAQIYPRVMLSSASLKYIERLLAGS